jgi:hypothetical protein
MNAVIRHDVWKQTNATLEFSSSQKPFRRIGISLCGIEQANRLERFAAGEH